MKNNMKIIICILCAVLLLNACKSASSQENAAKDTPAEKVENEHQSNLDVIQPLAYGNVEGLNLQTGSYISIIGRSGSGEFWKVLSSGAQQAIDDINKMLGYTGEDKIKMAYVAPSSKDSVDEQVNILDEELALYPVAVAIAIVDSTACEVQFDLAAENDIPIIAFESGSEYEAIESMISTNNIEAAQTAASKLSDAIEDTGKVLLFVHDSHSTSAKERSESFITNIEEEHPEITVDGIYHLDLLDEIRQQIADERNAAAKTDPAIAEGDTNAPTEPPAAEPEIVQVEDITDEEVFDHILAQHPDAKGCLATDSVTTQIVLTAVKTAKLRSFQIIGFEGGTQQLESLRNGDLAGLIVQNPYGMGYASVVAAARAALGMGNEAVVDCGYIWVTKDNMDTESIQKLLF